MESELILCMFLLSFGSICCTEYFDCGSKQVTIKDVAVQNCPGTGVCKLKKGTDASVDVTFIANQDINEVPVLLHGVMFNASLPYPGQYNKDGCIDSNLECPLQSGKEYTYKLSLPVYKKYPSVPAVTIRLQLSNIACIEIPARIV